MFDYIPLVLVIFSFAITVYSLALTFIFTDLLYGFYFLVGLILTAIMIELYKIHGGA